MRVGGADLATSYRLTVLRQSGDNVLLFTTLDVETIKRAYAQPSPHKITYEECYELPPGEESTHIWEPCWLTEKQEQRARELAAL